MVSHEHIGVNSTITMAGGVFKYCQVPVPIIIIEEASLSVVSTLRDMLWDVREIEALWSWHKLLASKKPYQSCQNPCGLENGQFPKNLKEIGSDPFLGLLCPFTLTP
jgi:hypothetical protein